MIRVAGWAALFFVLCLVTSWLIFATFTFHVLAAMLALGLAIGAFAAALIALARAFNEGGGW